LYQQPPSAKRTLWGLEKANFVYVRSDLNHTMNDFNYVIDPGLVYQGVGHRACRRAVLWPLVLAAAKAAKRRDPDAADVDPRDVAGGYAALLKLWRARLVALAAAGWRATKSTLRVDGNGAEVGSTADLRFTYLRNCPPFGVRLATRGHACHRPRACPLCFAREVVLEAFKTVEWAFFTGDPFPDGNGGGGRRGARPCVLPRTRLVALRRTFELPLPEQGGRPVAAWVAAAGRHRGNELAAVAGVARGGASLVTVEPGGRGLLRAVRATVLALPVDAPLDALADRRSTVLRTFDPPLTTAALARAVGWAFRYPTGMALGNASVAAEILNAAAATRSRMLTTTGVMRNRQVRRTADGGGDRSADAELE
jgi:hypothetical protein